MARLVLVEDDPAIAAPLRAALAQLGYDVAHCARGLDAIELVRTRGCDLVLLDLTLPDLDGLDVCRRLRAEHPSLPIVMLTARAEEVDLVVGFDAGADDYVTKPFSLGALGARLKARLRAAVPSAVVEAQDVRVDRSARRAWRGSDALELTRKEFELLALLVAEAGRTLPRSRIMKEVWDPHWYGPTRTLDMHVAALRRKLGDDPANSRYVSTVRGIGFRFEA